MFNKATQVLRIQPLDTKPNTHSMTATLKDVESSQHMIGSGLIHMLTPTYFENLQQQFQNILKGVDLSDIK